MARRVANLLVAFSLLLAPLPAPAQEQPSVVETCAAIDHFPAVPIGSAPSLAVLVILLTGIDPLIGMTLTAQVTGASGNVSGSGELDSHGVVEIPVPLFQYGEHRLTDLVSDHAGVEHVAGVEAGGTFIAVFDVDSGETECDADAMRERGDELRAAATTTSTSTTTTTTTTTSTTTTSTTTTTTTAPSTTVAETTQTGSRTPLALALIGPGALLVLVGLWLLTHPRGGESTGRDCSHLLALWQSAERRLREGETALGEARAGLAEARERVAELEAELASLEESANNYITEAGTNYHLIPGGRVTAEGLAEITATVRDSLQSARSRVESEQDHVHTWEARVAELQTAAAQAKSAYEACVGGSSGGGDTAETSPAGTATTGTSTTGTGAVGPSVVDETETDDNCVEGTRDKRPAGDPESINVTVDFSIFVEPEGIRDVEGAQTMAFGLTSLAQDLDLAGSLLGGLSAGNAVAGGLGAMRAGEYVTGAGGLVEGTVSGVMTGAGAHVGDGGMEISIPTSPPEALSEALEATARLGAVVASKVGEWLVKNELYHVRIRFFTQTITATPYEILECRDNEMVCVEKVYGISIGKLTRGGQPEPKTFRLDSELARLRFQQHLDTLADLAKTRLEEGARRRLEFEQAHQRGPCGS